MLGLSFCIFYNLVNFYFWKEITFTVSLMICACLFKPDYFFLIKHASSFLIVDNYSWPLIILSMWIITLCMMSSFYLRNQDLNSHFFLFLMLTLMLSLLYTFMFNNLMMFYMGFEFCLVPIFFIILGFGNQPERTEAGVYMFFYTLMGSLPLLIIILHVINMMGSSFYLNFEVIANLKLESEFILFFFILAFLIKFPIYSGHLWLLKAHVEAPVAGSMILAGVLLKLGGYGLIRVLVFMANSTSSFKEIFSAVSLTGAFLIGVSCLRHFDMKLLVASSSVVHMSFCIICIFLMTDLSFKGVMLTMIAHGLCSSGLFFGVNNIYHRTMSRSILINKGVMSFLPSFCFWWFLLLIGNMAAPPTINLLGEITMILSIMAWEGLVFLFISMVSFFSAVYSLYLFSLSTHGTYIMNKTSYLMSSVTDHLIFFLHILPINIFILCSFLLY